VIEAQYIGAFLQKNQSYPTLKVGIY
jgi:hypothetical protein